MEWLKALIGLAGRRGASDVHLEPGLSPAMRVRGTLELTEEAVTASMCQQAARSIVGADGWNDFQLRGSYDLSKQLYGIRCRINVLQSSRGVGLAIRLLTSFEASVETLNLHPVFHTLSEKQHGLILICGATGSGKSTTMAALLEEINRREARHIITIEHPIEYAFRPVKSIVRQREVGRDTPSFDQALLDAMREDPDVIMVGEMRRPETMMMTLNAAETGHLVLSTLHASTPAEAIQRMVSAFPAESQPSVRAQLADCLVAVVCQKLHFLPSEQLRVPECEILMASHAVKNVIRMGQFFKFQSLLETGGKEGSWSLERYRDWLSRKTDWHHLTPEDMSVVEEVEEPVHRPIKRAATPPPSRPQTTAAQTPPNDDVLVLDFEDDNLEDIISQLKKF